MFISVCNALVSVPHFAKGGLGGISTQAVFRENLPQSPFVKGGRFKHQRPN